MTGKLIFFWDFDTQWGADRSRSGSGAKSWGMDDFTNTEKLLDYHAQFNIPACFAVVGAAALPGERPYHDPNLIKRIYKAGHEIASHAMRHEWLPVLGREKLEEILSESKEVLEQCIGDRVITFVPPYNQPFDFLRKGSWSMSERKIDAQTRIDIPLLCKMLNKTGYRFTRIAYANPVQRLLTLGGFSVNYKANLETIEGIQTIRLNGKAGFAADALNRLYHAVQKKELVVIYGHPHSLSGSSSQSMANLFAFFEKANGLIKESKLQVVLPKELCVS